MRDNIRNTVYVVGAVSMVILAVLNLGEALHIFLILSALGTVPMCFLHKSSAELKITSVIFYMINIIFVDTICEDVDIFKHYFSWTRDGLYVSSFASVLSIIVIYSRLIYEVDN